MKTQSLDEAVFLVTKGFRYTHVRAIAEIHSEWTFSDCWELEDAVKEFWTGKAEVNITQWLMIRTHMKTEQKRLLSEKFKKLKRVRQKQGGADMRYQKAHSIGLSTVMVSCKSVLTAKRRVTTSGLMKVISS